MKIIIYDPNTKEWSNFISSLNCGAIQQDKIIQDHIVEIGQEISALEFVNNNHSYSKLSYEFIGEPCNPLEKTIKFVYSDSNYFNMKRRFPEDFIENRTDWDEMADYADEMANFINKLMKDIANTK